MFRMPRLHRPKTWFCHCGCVQQITCITCETADACAQCFYCPACDGPQPPPGPPFATGGVIETPRSAGSGWYDQGCWLPPGLTMAFNSTGKYERVAAS